MLYTSKDLAKKLNCRTQSVTQYMCRGCFSHIKVYKKRTTLFYENMTEEDLALLKDCIEYGRKRSGHINRKKEGLK